MIREWLTHSPVLALPIFALVLFILVFAGVVVIAFSKKREEIDACARLPLSQEDER